MKNNPLISVIDYGMGNLRSVAKALEKVGARSVITRNPAKILASDGVVFPGVGAFGPALKNIKGYRLIEPIRQVISSGKPFLGLCLGFQLLYESSCEGGRHKGLGIIPGSIVKFDFRKSKGLKVPHMGWNQVKHSGNPEGVKKMFAGIPDNSYFYFVHSYYGIPRQSGAIAGKTGYGVKFCSAIVKNSVWACQFHPEKSGKTGLKLLKNFVGEVKRCL